MPCQFGMRQMLQYLDNVCKVLESTFGHLYLEVSPPQLLGMPMHMCTLAALCY